MNIAEARNHISESMQMQSAPNYQLKEDITQGKNIIIYGAGGNGKLFYSYLRFLGISVVAFLDRAAKPAQMLFDLPVHCADSEKVPRCYKDHRIIIALDRFKCNINEIVSYLNDLGFKDVIYSNHLLCKANYYNINTTFNIPIVDLKQEESEINKALELLEDDHSREAFCSYLRAYATSEFDHTFMSKGCIDYVRPGLTLNKGFARFVDCGAFTGDTFQDIKKHHNMDSYIGFEPSGEIYKRLLDTVKNEAGDTVAFLYPCAVGDKTFYTSFDAELNARSSLSEDGKQTVLVVKLDELLINVNPTMIKMDIEGAEIDALKGCKDIIKNSKPDLAICVYHRLTDLWRIPLMIHEIVPEYKLYMRCHYIATIQTVLYATC
ncbi:methyltransferase FkbM family [Syntrophobotulus glycolicus DSM 8271]|uniref:Methyltransferase FkbM family n=1 Tax=Syntrophobotulus glycolicus (strain DSM 8271 / FlGlyR) TaxID=645991 RepID=F0SZC6_SYNGF|nr:FkbM family methyltransferase [Syntrophobotulus glycolicus]ADY54931.1 methyltransferase FkbM family [Syntrophobotulus glycolicus DSM 8271]